MNLPDSRILVVHNQHSANAEVFQQLVARPLQEAAYAHDQVVLFPTPSPDSATNIAAVAEQMKDDDIVLACGGDGTAHITFNSAMHADAEIAAMGFLGFGNVNDGAHTFSGAKHLRDPSIVGGALNEDKIVTVHPLEVTRNEQLLRYGLLYASLGLTARIGYEFNTDEARKRSGEKRNSMLSNGLRAVKYFRQTRGDYPYVPAYSLEGEAPHTDDVLFMNGPRMAEGVRTNQALYADETYLRAILDLPPQTHHTLLTASRLLISRVLPIKGEKRSYDELSFDESSQVLIQIDGETETLNEVKKIAVRKSITDIPGIRVIKTSHA